MDPNVDVFASSPSVSHESSVPVPTALSADAVKEHTILTRTDSINAYEPGRTSSPGVFSNHSRTTSPITTSQAPKPDELHNRNASPSHDVYRAASPASVHSFSSQGPPISATSDPYRPSRLNTQTYGSIEGVAVDPYAPKTQPERKMTSPTSAAPYASPYLPQKQPNAPPRSLSISSTTSAKSEDPYAPSLHSRIQSNDSDYAPYTMHGQSVSDIYSNPGSSAGLGAQDIYMKAAPTHTPYAPSPSLLGTNDPLGRASARIPVFSFGFGGRIVTCFHGADKLNTGFDVALASKNSTGIQIQVLNKVIPESALSVSAASYPGPLFSDPGTPTTSLVRPGASAQAKTKKARVVNYLEARATEISQGLNYLHSGSLEQRRADGKLALVKLLKIMVENDGKISGSPQIDSAVRAALVPRLDSSLPESDSSLTVPGFTPADVHSSSLDGGFADPNDTPNTTYSIRPSALEKIQDFLLRGQRRQAYHYALDQKLWAHAMVIASGIDKEAWQEAVNEFVKTELGSVRGQSSGRESLRVAYGLMSGQGAAAVQQLVPQSSLSDPGARLLAPISHATPMTPNFATALPGKIPEESLSQWTETVAMALSGTPSHETFAAITALGDHLAANHWTEAAHACYLLSPQTSQVTGMAHQPARIVLLGSQNPQTAHSFTSDPDPIIFSEILEFALSLATVKGQEPFGGLPHLQPYRFVRATQLAEFGDISLANRYCEAITASLNRPSPYFTNVLIDQLRGLSNRIVGVTHVDKAGSWMGAKLGKPSLDSIGGWLEGRFTKLVTGDPDSPGIREEQSKTEERGYVGAFSQYSTISSTTTSTSPSPQSSVTNLNAYAAPPPRTGSSMSSRSTLGVISPTDRASSAMDYSRPKPSPGPRVASASAATTTFAQAQSFGQAVSQYSPYSHFGNGDSSQDLMTPRPTLESTEEEGQEATWWGSSSAATPTATSFVQLHSAPTAASSDGFVSLMDDTNFAPASKPQPAQRQNFVEDDEEDLGFGNSKPRSKPASTEDTAQDDANPSNDPRSTEAPQHIRPTANTSASGSWLSRLWKRESTPAPVKANLGEEVSFYFDKELKRWVNKSTGGNDTAKATPPPPPPPRAQTASPAGSAPRPPSAGVRPPSTGPPPLRSASTADLGSAKPPMRIRSNLVPDSEVGSAPSTPTGSRLAPPAPPPGRPRSQASKRNIRNRYVDVFQQEGAA
ncbi:hypothetical protein K435DRAFT_674707 [Dendrothele bispora CBS 962.96]|uniref:Protein transport protein sec16 n=1 Tax=Dendrothele bispora (strain CBS 962.96) TaxID=1314807 RepID=A0A4S8LP95_DENBC|nr:hypothetical protein K435DRAFT_674707 [Dendrothele bispora CBS 962.96]